MQYSRWHWIHPCGWLLWVTVLSYVIFSPLAWLYSGTEVTIMGVLTYTLAVAVFIAPILLIPQKPLRIGSFRFDRRYTMALVFVYVIISIIRLSVHIVDYEVLRITVSSSLFYMNIFSWLLIFTVLTLPFVAKYRGFQILMVTAELSFLFMSGFREWLIVFGLGIILVFAGSGIKIRWGALPALLLIFIFIISPVWLAQRSASSYLTGLTKYEQQQETRGKLHHTGRYFYNHYSDFVFAASARIGATGDASMRIVQQVPNEKEVYNLREFGSKLNTIIVPRVLWTEKPEFRPGEEVYATFYDDRNERRISHPVGFIGEIWWLAGWWSLLLLPLFSSLLVGLASLLLNRTTNWLFLHFMLIFIFTESHLLFYLSAWLRVLPVYLIFWYLINKFK